MPRGTAIDVGDLIVAKVLAGRSKDVEDRTLRLLEEALSQGDLTPTFESIVRPSDQTQR
jgi:hypothetical protein